MWAEDAIFYHIYPLGLCAAPLHNDFITSPVERLNTLYAWADHSQWLGANAWYLGPVFRSESHGYDTVDFLNVDRRLGTDSTLANLSAELHRRGMRLVLDAVLTMSVAAIGLFRMCSKTENNPLTAIGLRIYTSMGAAHTGTLLPTRAGMDITTW